MTVQPKEWVVEGTLEVDEICFHSDINESLRRIPRRRICPRPRRVRQRHSTNERGFEHVCRWRHQLENQWEPRSTWKFGPSATRSLGMCGTRPWPS